MAGRAPDSPEALAAEVARAGRSGLKVLPKGRGTRMPPEPGGATGEAPLSTDLVLETTGLARIVHYEPDDLTVTVEAGCGLAALDAVLGERGQLLPLQGRYGGGTVGGLLATAPEGALALAHGAPRDRMIGLRAVLADGSLVKGGGRVVKNVAGLPVHRLMTGSYGTLGVIVEASFKVQPRPDAEATLLAAFSSVEGAFEASRLVLASGTEPGFVNVLVEDGRVQLATGYDGLAARVDRHVHGFGTLIGAAHPDGIRVLGLEEADELRRRLDDPCESAARADARSPAPPADHGGPGRGIRAVVHVRVLPAQTEPIATRTRSALEPTGVHLTLDARPGLGTIMVVLEGDDPIPMTRAVKAVLSTARGRGPVSATVDEHAEAHAAGPARRGPGLPRVGAEPDPAKDLPLGAASGHAVLLSAPAGIWRNVDPWGPPAVDFAIMRRIKHALDPGGVFPGGRFVGGL